LTCSKHIGTDGRPHSSFVHDACAPQEQFHISHSDVDFTCKGRKCCMTEDILQTDASCQHGIYDQAYHLSGEIVVVCSWLLSLGESTLAAAWWNDRLGVAKDVSSGPPPRRSLQDFTLLSIHRRGIHISEMCSILNYTAEAKSNTRIQRPPKRTAWPNNLDAVQDRLRASAPHRAVWHSGGLLLTAPVLKGEYPRPAMHNTMSV
jgi:hypothetical protein